VRVRRPDDLHAGADPSAWLAGYLLLLVFSPLALAATVAGHALLRLGRARPWMLAAGAAGLLLLVVLVAGGPAAALVGHFAPLASLVHSPHAPTVAELGRVLVAQVPLGLPVGLVVAGLVELSRPSHELDPASRARVERERDRKRARAVKLAAAPRVAADQPPPLATWIGGDLSDWRQGDYLIVPASVRALPRVVLGITGFGKTTMLEREAFMAATEGEPCHLFDGKGTDGELAGRIIAAYLAANPAARVGLYPEVPMDGWRGGPQAVLNRLLSCIDYTGAAEFHGDRLNLVLRLALFAPGQPAVSSSRELLDRLEPGRLAELWKGHPAEAGEVRTLFGRDGRDDPTLRLRALLAAVGRSLDGSWSFEDVDLAIITAPSLEQAKDASAVMRYLLTDYADFAVARKEPGRQTALLFDEFSALLSGQRAAIDLVERVRGSAVAVLLCAQSFEGLGSDYEAARILHACSGGLTVFRLADPERVLALAGTIREPELTHQLGPAGPAGRAMAKMADVARVNANEVRAFAPGEAVVIEGGRAEHVRIIRNQLPAGATTDAAALVRQARSGAAGGPSGGWSVSWAARNVREPLVGLEGPRQAVLVGRQRPASGDRTPEGFLLVRPPERRP
jgi:hypothetical protein